MSPTALADDLRAHAFRGARRAPGWRIGAEVELIALSAATRRPLPLHAAPGRSDGPGAPNGAALLPLLRQVAAWEGWREEPSPHGAPCFHLRGGAVLSLEPGGQLELSSATSCSVGTLLAQLNAALAPLERHAADGGSNCSPPASTPTTRWMQRRSCCRANATFAWTPTLRASARRARG